MEKDRFSGELAPIADRYWVMNVDIVINARTVEEARVRADMIDMLLYHSPAVYDKQEMSFNEMED